MVATSIIPTTKFNSVRTTDRDSLNDLMDRLFFGGFGVPVSYFGNSNGFANNPDARVSKAEDGSYSFRVSVPGVNKEEVKVSVEKSVLTISYIRPQGSDSFVDSFKREWRLDKDSDINGITAHFNNGVLTVSVPRLLTAPPLTRQIEIN